MPKPEPASSPCQAPPGYWGEETSVETTFPFQGAGGRKPQVIRVSADCNCSGVEVEGPDGRLVMTDPAELGLSSCLCSDLHFWQRWFDGVFHHCPPEERCGALGNQFDEVGKHLA